MSAFDHDPASCTRMPCRRCGPKGVANPPPAIDQNVGQQPEAPDPTVRSIGLPSHPDPATMAAVGEEAAKAIRSKTLLATDMASTLAAKGYSARTLGDGGSRGTDTTSSTERLASRPANRWDAADHAYAAALRDFWRAGLAVIAQTDELLRHASDIDPTPAGTGECRACARFVRPTKQRSSFRLRSGLCPSCFGAWSNYRGQGGSMLWSEWVSRRRESFTERDLHGNVVAIHTPEPEESGQGA